jgi:plasmid stabilization system protein ParE
MRARRLCYTLTAKHDLQEIRDYLRREAGPRVAARMLSRIRSAVARARETPRLGTPRPAYRQNCRFILSRPYVVYYDFDGVTMSMLRVLHQAQDRDVIMRPPPPQGS